MHRPSRLRTARSGATSGADRPPRPANTAAGAHGALMPAPARRTRARGQGRGPAPGFLGPRSTVTPPGAHRRPASTGAGADLPRAGVGPRGERQSQGGSGSGPGSGSTSLGERNVHGRELRPAAAPRAGNSPPGSGSAATGSAPGPRSGRLRGEADRPRRRARHRKNDWVPTGGPGNAKHRKGVPRRRRGRRRILGYPFVRVYVGG